MPYAGYNVLLVPVPLVMPAVVLYTVIPGEVAAAPEPSSGAHTIVLVSATCGKRIPPCVLCTSNMLPAAGSDVAGVPVPSFIFCCAFAPNVAVTRKHKKINFVIVGFLFAVNKFVVFIFCLIG